MAVGSSSSCRASWDAAPKASQSLFPAAGKGFALVEEVTCRVVGTKSMLPVLACITVLGPTQAGTGLGGLGLHLAGFEKG